MDAHFFNTLLVLYSSFADSTVLFYLTCQIIFRRVIRVSVYMAAVNEKI
jgi:3'-phosphoadenosine 5'-phosphosulfate sulfotransferase (PAPS reductase)/FAD synthetase